MPNTTTNLGLKKPLITEEYDIAIVTNDNADLLDADIGTKLYTENNYIVDDESLTSSINKLDIALKDVADSVGSGDAIDITFTPYGNIVATDVQNAIEELDDEKATYTVYTATIPSASWTGSSAPYSKAVTVTGILSTDEPIIDLVLSGTYATDVTMRTNWGLIYRGVTSTDTITFYADSVPSADINIQLVVVR
jgi:hypothetical protein